MTRETVEFAHPELVGGGQTSKHSHAGGGASVSTPDTVIVNGVASPASWTDLDTGLGGVAFVTLTVEAIADMNATAIRRKGDTKDYYDATVDVSSYGNQLGHHDSTFPLVLSCFADSSGFVQWITEDSETATITIIGVIG